jgi:hypothetical protein
MTPIELMQSFNELQQYWTRTVGDANVAASKQIVAAVASHPTLIQQIPWSRFDMCVRISKGLSPVAD